MTLVRPVRERHQHRPQSSATVGYVFGVLEATAVPGSILVPLLTDLGLSPAAIRTMLHRMVAAGNLVSERVGRIAVYRLAGPYAERFRQFRRGDGPPVWAGRFQLVLYNIPESSRQRRDELREMAFKSGFGATRPGVLIGMRDPRSWCEPWLDSPHLSVELGELVCDVSTARRLAEQAWGLTAIASTLVHFGRDLAAVSTRLHNDEYSDREVFRLQASLWDRWVAILLQLPALPAELTPDPWPADELPAAMTSITRDLQPRAIAHSETAVSRAERADLLELLPDLIHRRAART